MDGTNEEPLWDEYQWERFFRQQDEKTERYMELMERYLDHPKRDEMIAKEMGWDLGDPSAVLGQIEEPSDTELDALEAEEIEDEEELIESHPLYRAAIELTLWVDDLLADHAALHGEPEADHLSSGCSLATAKVAAALSNSNDPEIGMTIAYLKRALKAIGETLDAATALTPRFAPGTSTELRHRIFQVRDRIVTLMGTCRAQWRKR